MSANGKAAAVTAAIVAGVAAYFALCLWWFPLVLAPPLVTLVVLVFCGVREEFRQ